jgi:hypothetical protein
MVSPYPMYAIMGTDVIEIGLLQDGDEAKRNADVADIMNRCDFSAAALSGDQTMSSTSATLLGAVF